jgi:hypothetical protein
VCLEIEETDSSSWAAFYTAAGIYYSAHIFVQFEKGLGVHPIHLSFENKKKLFSMLTVAKNGHSGGSKTAIVCIQPS